MGDRVCSFIPTKDAANVDRRRKGQGGERAKDLHPVERRREGTQGPNCIRWGEWNAIMTGASNQDEVS